MSKSASPSLAGQVIIVNSYWQVFGLAGGFIIFLLTPASQSLSRSVPISSFRSHLPLRGSSGFAPDSLLRCPYTRQGQTNTFLRLLYYSLSLSTASRKNQPFCLNALNLLKLDQVGGGLRFFRSFSSPLVQFEFVLFAWIHRARIL